MSQDNIQTSLKTIYDYLELSAKKYPDKIVIYENNNSITYFDLFKSSKFTSYEIQKLTSPGQTVSLLCENSIDFVIIYFGILMAGCTVHIIPPNSSNNQIILQVEKVKPEIIFHSEMLKNKINTLKNTQYPISSFIKNSIQNKINADEIPNKFYPVSSIIFTSGTTGNPKGVKIKHENIIFVINNIIKILKICSDDVEVNPLQLSHSFGLGCLHTIIAQGATTVIFQNATNLKKILSEINNKNATGFVAVPATFQKILEQHKQKFSEVGKNLTYLLTNSAPMPKNYIEEIIDLFPISKFFTYYGLTEASRSTFLLFNENLSKIESVGKPAPFVEIKIIDQNGKNLLAGEIGQVMIKGPNVVDSYVMSIEKNSKIKNGWIETGDLGFFDNDGYLYLRGRKDDLINVSGEKISPIEVELVIRQLNGINDVAVIGIPDKTFGEIPIAYVSTNNEIKLDTILVHCIKILERYKIPQKFIFLDSLPKNEFGKTEKNKLRTLYLKK